MIGAILWVIYYHLVMAIDPDWFPGNALSWVNRGADNMVPIHPGLQKYMSEVDYLLNFRVWWTYVFYHETLCLTLHESYCRVPCRFSRNGGDALGKGSHMKGVFLM